MKSNRRTNQAFRAVAASGMYVNRAPSRPRRLTVSSGIATKIDAKTELTVTWSLDWKVKSTVLHFFFYHLQRLYKNGLVKLKLGIGTEELCIG